MDIISKEINYEYEAYEMLRRTFTSESRYGVKSDESFKKKVDAIYDKCEILIEEIRVEAPDLTELMSAFGQHGNALTFAPYTLYNYLKRHGDHSDEQFIRDYLVDLVGESYEVNDTPYEIVKNSAIPTNQKWYLLWLIEDREALNHELEIAFAKLVPVLKVSYHVFDEEFAIVYNDWNSMALDGTLNQFILDNMGLSELEADSYSISMMSNNSFYFIDTHGAIGSIFTKQFFIDNVMNDENSVRIFKLLGDVSKYAILKELVDGRKYGKELSLALNLSPATISYHIQDLINERLILITPSDSNRIYYEINKEKIIEALHFIKGALELE